MKRLFSLELLLRSVARCFDYLLLVSLILFGVLLSPWTLSDIQVIYLFISVPFLFLPFEIFLQEHSTPGKKLLGIAIPPRSGLRLFLQACVSSFMITCLSFSIYLGVAAAILVYVGYALLVHPHDGDHIKIKKYSSIRLACAAFFSSLMVSPLISSEVSDSLFSQDYAYQDIESEEVLDMLPSKWKNFSSEEFTIQFPEKPEHETKDIPIPNSEDSLPLDEYQCAYEEGAIQYSVSYTTLPNQWLQWSPNLVLKGSVRFIAKHMGNAEVISKEVKRFRDLPALDFCFHQKEREVSGKLVLVGNKLYKIQVSYPIGYAPHMKTSIDAFLDSFSPAK